MRSNFFTRSVALGGVLALSLAPVAHAASGENTPIHLGTSSAVHAAGAGGSGSSILRTIVALIVVIAVIYGIAKILKAVKRKGGVRASGSGLEQIATLPLGPGRSLALVRAGRDIVLVGIAEHGVTPIKTYTEAEAIAGGIEVPSEHRPDLDQAERPFARALDQLRRITVRS
jgi:flagellar protein FliO/FliZ